MGRGGAAALVAALYIMWGQTAWAGPIGEAAAEAERLSGAGRPVEALAALDRAAEAIWQASPLTVRKALFVTEPSGFGLYRPKESSLFRPGETATAYVEPIGFAYGEAAGGYAIALGADLAIEVPGGQVVGEADDLFDVRIVSHERNREFNMALSFAVPDLKPGAYVGVFTLRDRNSDKTGRFELPFTVGN
ncbi:hypothetical protein [Propylenella binzhouense]|uniref:Uncharacterized protein n=1 Tax=Propylenella binzhouense TaxID=2555902 RepID=A0A964WS24_9HYPH|nr:hypothetical protein [Propylenella binzhouense]MYZ46519.1 hypothetical protein [Propylenella binzhouense]